MRSTFLCLAAALLGAGLATHPTTSQPEAGTAIRMAVENLVDRADLVIEGHVASATPVDLDGVVYTDYQLLVDRTWWGEDLGSRTIRLPGGVLPSGRATMVPGMPSVVPGDDVILALTETDGLERRVVVGLSQGRWRVVGNGQGGKLAVRDSEGGALVLRPGATPVPSDRMDVMGYADLVSQLEAAAGARRARGEDR